jgi:3-methylfumaryl-CoA hydratase
MLQTDLSQWVGKTQSQNGRLGGEIAQMLHAVLGQPEATAPANGDAMPALWHWAAFTPKMTMDKITQDGHPQRGDFLPPVKLARRMWAGGDVTFHAPLYVEENLRQVSTITSIDEKSETMVFVTVSHETYVGDTLAVSEIQNIVYLEIPDTFTPPKARPVPAQTDFAVQTPMNEVRLFRYSAATYNAHRIHYDLAYAQQVEKYPGLVVHGPLQATLLLQAAIDHTGRAPASFSYRGVHPLFHTDDLHVFGYDASDEGMSLCTGVPGGHQGQQATVTWRGE